jgi:hypothetical protein
MTALALPASAHRATIPQEEWGTCLSIPARMRIEAMRPIMEQLDAVPRGKTMQAYAAAMARTGLSLDRTKALHLKWRKLGEYGLIDHRICGGCGLPGCGNAHHKSALHPNTVEAWARKAEQNGSNQTNGARSFERSWEWIMAEIEAGREVPGLGHDGTPGDWRDLWLRVRPTDALPRTCPWSVSLPPPGHGLSNFRLKKPAKIETVAATEGLGKALQLLPQVQMDWGTLRPLELLIVDDKRFDFHAWMRLDGVIQIVEVWSLFVMDACTRRILWCELKPKIRRADGTTEGISHRDVQHLVTKVLATYGVPKNYRQRWIVENAAAALPHSFDSILERATGGQSYITRSGLWDGRVTVGGFIQRGGNPRGKSILESSFGHQLDIALGWIKGQIGGNYSRKPGDAEARLQYAQQLVKKMGPISTDEEMESMGVPVESLPKIRSLLLQAFQTIESRRRHRLQGFDKVQLWRMNEEDKWRSMTDPMVTKMLARPHGLEMLNLTMQQPGCQLERPETKIERWNRLYDGSEFEALSPAALFDLWLDTGTCKYAGTGVFTAKTPRGGLTYEFRCRVHPFQAGEIVTLRYDADNLSNGAALADDHGRVQALARYEGRIAFDDEKARERSLGDKMHERAELLKRVDSRHTSSEVLDAQIAEVEGQVNLITANASRAGSLRPATETSDELVDAFANDGRSRSKKSKAPTMEEVLAANLRAASRG